MTQNLWLIVTVYDVSDISNKAKNHVRYTLTNFDYLFQLFLENNCTIAYLKRYRLRTLSSVIKNVTNCTVIDLLLYKIVKLNDKLIKPGKFEICTNSVHRDRMSRCTWIVQAKICQALLTWSLILVLSHILIFRRNSPHWSLCVVSWVVYVYTKHWMSSFCKINTPNPV